MRKVLIFGNGRIGGHIKKLISPFTNNIPHMYDILTEKSDMNYGQMIKQISDFDIIFLSLKYRGEEIITRDIIQKISNECILVNISRGELINEIAVLEKIKRNKNFFIVRMFLIMSINIVKMNYLKNLEITQTLS